MEPRISLVTLGVADIAESTAFYERLGFPQSPAGNEFVSFFQLRGGLVLGLFGRDSLAEDAGVPTTPPGGFSGITIAYNVRTEGEVATVLESAVEAGATLVKPAQKVFWGGTSGYFADPDGHLWEVAHNPFFPLDDNGGVVLPA
ncbi:MAG: VOC family protein [Rhodobiaceae bacterium]|nr:VOC family protein [Rhodobiaceae bacterium]